MATIVRTTLEIDARAPLRWASIARSIVDWANAANLPLRDAIVLVPFAQLLPEARRAFVRTGGWMPRIETTHTLAATLGPVLDQPGQVSFDRSADTLVARALLRSRPSGAALARRDPRGFDQAAESVVATAHALVRAASAWPIAERDAHWQRAREVLTPGRGPGAMEGVLALVALEWASLAPPQPSDRLFTMRAPSAWIAVQAGGADRLVERLLFDASCPCLVVDTDESPDDPFGRIDRHPVPALAVCASFEDEAQCAAAQVLAHVQRGETPVALIAQDRVLVRRVRALLDRQTLVLLDERGWKLSTTRAAAQVMALLDAARTDAGTDDLLDWLKAGSSDVEMRRSSDVSALESACRRKQIASVSALAHVTLEGAAARAWAAAASVLEALPVTRRLALPGWLAALSNALANCNALAALQVDDAGRQVIDALRLAPDAGTAAWSQAAAAAVMGFDEFRAWVGEELEDATFRPGTSSSEAPDVVITALPSAMLRPFAAIVFPGADDKQLGVSPVSASLVGDAQAGALGAPTAAERRTEELLAFTQILASPRVTLLRRRVDGTDPLADSPLVERLALALAKKGLALADWHDPRIATSLPATPIHMTAPAAPSLLPKLLSASALEALRACPYRFFALNMLKLREDDELEREVEKRDYGTWLHDVLFEFHNEREAGASADAEIAALMRTAKASQAKQGLSDADFLPFAASFETFAPRYVAWLHERDAHGAHWLRGEERVVAEPPILEGTQLHGVIDRIDEWRRPTGTSTELIDYKTGSAQSLRDKVKLPLEDTQLAFYAALMLTRSDVAIGAGGLKASYLALDGSKKLEEIEHPRVEESAVMLVDGLAHDLRRLRAGAGLPALGVGSTCDFCAARGICRRDHWSSEGST